LAWRWDLAGEIAAGQRISRDRIDSAVAAAAAFRKNLVKGKQPAKNRKPDRDALMLEAAYEMFTADGLNRWELEARLLAGQTDAEISARCGLPADAVAIYETIFFHVRPCTASDYLIKHAVGRGVWCGFDNEEVRQFWAYCGLAGGPVVVDLVVDAFRCAHVAGQPPALSTYLRPDAGISPDLQAFVASSVLPPYGPTAEIFLQLQLRALKANATDDADRAAFIWERIRGDLIRCGRAFLAGTRLPVLKRRRTADHATPGATIMRQGLISGAAFGATLLNAGDGNACPAPVLLPFEPRRSACVDGPVSPLALETLCA
jgi:hypothetical protein